MRGTKFPQATRSLRPPAGMTEDECLPLYVFQDGQHVISRWQPDDVDRARIAARGPVWLWILGTSMQPASLATENPFGKEPAIPAGSMPADVRIAELEHEVAISRLAVDIAQAELHRLDPAKYSAPEAGRITAELAQWLLAAIKAAGGAV